MPRSRKVLAVLAAVAAILVAVRLSLPFAVRWYVNRKLANLEGYTGHVDDVGLSLWRGAYQLNGLKIRERKGDGETEPFFSCRALDLSLSWSALFHRKLAAKVRLERPILTFRPEAAKEEEREKLKRGGESAKGAMMPLELDQLTIRDGELRYSDHDRKPPIDLRIKDIQADGANLRSTPTPGELLPGRVKLTAVCFDSGKMDLDVRVDAAAKKPTFELKEKMEGVQLVKLNDFLQAYAKFKVKSGTLQLYTEVAAKDGSFIGYTKPIVKDFHVDKHTNDTKAFLRRVWSEVVGAVGQVLKNPKKGQLATKVPVKGTFKDADVNVWYAIGGLLRNAFVQALKPSFDNTIDIGDVGK
jgi:hypothetical protein